LLTGPFEAALPLVLASASPRRKELLASLGLAFEILSIGEEPPPLPGEDAAGYAQRAARHKAVAVSAERPEAVVVAADTVVVVDGEPLGKPADEDEALRMLAVLVGREHTVVTGCCLIPPRTGGLGRETMLFAVETRVVMAPAPLEVLFAYAATGEPLDKAGAYAIQGRGGFLVESISGSFSNVVGLPLAETVRALSEMGAIRPVQRHEEAE